MFQYSQLSYVGKGRPSQPHPSLPILSYPGFLPNREEERAEMSSLIDPPKKFPNIQVTIYANSEIVEGIKSIIDMMLQTVSIIAS